MKLVFSKDFDGSVLVHVDDKPFTQTDYIKMIHQIKDKQIIEAEFTADITPDEQDRVNAMLKEINQAGVESKSKKAKKQDEIEYPKEDINPDDIPF